MFLIRLIYASKVDPSVSVDDIIDITDIAKHNNPQIDVTGVLCYNNNYFLQCLEGSRLNVNQLYHKILNDPRHTDPAILQYEEIAERDFYNWSMAYIPPAEVSGELILQYSGDKQFNPYSMSGERCYRLMKTLHSHQITR